MPVWGFVFDKVRSLRVTLLFLIFAMTGFSLIIPIFRIKDVDSNQADWEYDLTLSMILLTIPLFTLLPLYQMSLSSGIVTIFGKFCGGKVLSMMATARAIGATVPAIGIVFNNNALEEVGGVLLPNMDNVQWYFYAASAPLATMGVFLLFLNPYPIVKEIDTEKLFKENKEKNEPGQKNKTENLHIIDF
jgi:hypothetical protein